MILVKGKYMQSSTFFLFFFFLFFAEGFLPVLRSRCDHEGIKCFSKYEGMQELGS